MKNGIKVLGNYSCMLQQKKCIFKVRQSSTFPEVLFLWKLDFSDAVILLNLHDSLRVESNMALGQKAT